MGTFHLKAGDTSPAFRATLRNPDDTVHDLTGEVPYLHIHLDTGAKLTRTMAIVGAPTAGVVQYSWLDSDWGASAIPRANGNHVIEVEAVGSKRTTFPNRGEDRLKVTADIADG